MRTIAGALALLLGLLAAGCNGELVGGGQTPARLVVVSGDMQTGTVGEELPQPLVVRVVDENDRPVANQLVNFVVTAGGGSVFAGSAITNAQGEARERWRLGTVAGDTQTVEARAVDSSTGEPIVFATFHAVARAAAPAQVIAEAPADRSPGPLGATFSPPLAARVVDAHGNGIPGLAVTWTVNAGGTLTGASTMTDGAGRVSASWTLGTQGGVQQVVEVSAAGVAQPARFTSTTVPGDVTLAVVSGNDQAGTVGQPLPQPVVVEVRGLGNKLLGNVQVSASSSSGTLAPATVMTDAQGRASFTWTLPATPGPVMGLAQVVGASPASQPVQLRATAQASGPASMQVSVFGSAGPFIILNRAHPVTVILRDAQNNLLPGVQVTGTVEGGGGSVTGPATTGADGAATLQWTTGTTEGSVQRLRVSAGGLTTTITREGHYVWVTPVTPQPGTVVTAPTLTVTAGASHYLGGFSSGPNDPVLTVTYGGRSTELGRLPTSLTWRGELNLAGLPAGPLDLVFRIEYQGHVDQETVSIVYQP